MLGEEVDSGTPVKDESDAFLKRVPPLTITVSINSISSHLFGSPLKSIKIPDM
jgi:hypothetical protein